MNTGLELHSLTIGHERDLKQFDEICIQGGSVVALTGPNGCGKTTLLKTIGTLLKPRSGHISWQGSRVDLLHSAQLSKVMSQHLSSIKPFGELTVREIWTMGSSHDILRSQAIEYWSVKELIDRHFSTLSDGQRQKVLLVRAFLSKAPLLMMDEPTSYLDYHAVKEFIEIIKDLQKNHAKTILFSSHDWGLIEAVCHEVIHFPEHQKSFLAQANKVREECYS